jgi:hypothetical protein
VAVWSGLLLLAVWVLWYFGGLLWRGMPACVWSLFDNAADQWRGEEGCDFVKCVYSWRGRGIEEVVEVDQKYWNFTEQKESRNSLSVRILIVVTLFHLATVSICISIYELVLCSLILPFLNRVAG